MKMKKGKNGFAKLKFGLLVMFIVVLVAVYFITAIKGYGIFDGIKSFVLEHEEISPVIFMGLFIISAFFPLPFLTILGATVFGFWEVFILSLIGNIFNATIIFYFARWTGREFVEKYEDKHEVVKKFDKGFEKNAFIDMILLRFFYPLPLEIGNLLGGLSRMKFKDFIFATIIGLVPVLIASIVLVEGKMSGNNITIAVATILFILLLAIPLISLANLRKYSKEKAKAFVEWNNK